MEVNATIMIRKNLIKKDEYQVPPWSVCRSGIYSQLLKLLIVDALTEFKLCERTGIK
jgi:hypothetical protein